VCERETATWALLLSVCVFSSVSVVVWEFCVRSDWQANNKHNSKEISSHHVGGILQLGGSAATVLLELAAPGRQSGGGHHQLLDILGLLLLLVLLVGGRWKCGGRAVGHAEQWRTSGQETAIGQWCHKQQQQFALQCCGRIWDARKACTSHLQCPMLCRLPGSAQDGHVPGEFFGVYWNGKKNVKNKKTANVPVRVCECVCLILYTNKSWQLSCKSGTPLSPPTHSCA